MIRTIHNLFETEEHPVLLPVAVLITSILSVPFIVLMIVPLTIHCCRPIIVGPRPIWPHLDNCIVKALYVVFIGT